MPPTRRSDGTRRLVLDAAEREFLARGYSGTRVESVAGAAHVGVGTIYLHFRNKEGLYSAVLLRAETLLLEEYIAPVFELTVPPWERIRAWCRAYLRFTTEHPDRARLMAVIEWSDARWLPDVTAEVRGQIDASYQRLRAVFEEAAERDELDDVDPDTAARFLWWAMYGIAAQNVRHPQLRLDRDALYALADGGLLLMSGGRIAPASQIDA